MFTTLSQIALNIVADTVVLGVLALGMGMRVRSAQVYDFSYFAMFLLGAYVAWSIVSLSGTALVIASLLALVVASATALLVDLAVLRSPLIQGRSLEAMIASLGVFVIAENAISLVAGADTKVLAQDPPIAHTLDWLIGSPILNSHQLFGLLTGALVILLVVTLLATSKWGLRFRAADDNRELALALGLRPWRLVSETQILCAALAALSGILYALDRDITPDMAIRPMLHVTVAIVLGGLGTLLGPVIGLLAVTTTWHVTGFFLETQWQDLSVFLILLIVLLVTPQGLSGTLTGTLRNT